MPETNQHPACPIHLWYDYNRECPSCVENRNRFRPPKDLTALDPDIELIEAQKAGEDICGRSPLEKGRDALDGLYDMVRDMQDGDRTETNGMGFYVDGYTLASTDEIGEVKLTSYDGRTCVVKSSSLVAWIERRLTPAEETS